MARKKMRKFAGGGMESADDIVVKGKRSRQEMSNFDLGRLNRAIGMDRDLGARMGRDMNMVSGGVPITPRSNFSVGKVNTPAGSVYGPRFATDRFNIGAGLGRGAIGQTGAPVAGISGGMRFKKGGKVKKMAKGGSTASKRADGCATKGKTKGRFV